MSDENATPAPSTLSFSQAAHVDSLCDRFEAAWRAGERPSIERWLAEVAESARSVLLAELLSVEVGWRRRYRERPAAQEYLEQFPEDSALIIAALGKAGTILEGRSAEGTTTAIATAETASGGERPVSGPGFGWVGLRYQIKRRHARGGLGEVFLAQDETLNREVALKQIRPEYAGDLVCQSRFVREAEITGGLGHPGIVPIYGLGRHGDGSPFYVMPFIRGSTLQDAIARFHRPAVPNDRTSQPTRILEFRKLLARFLEVCNAIDYAHDQGVIHRDLKPSNVMLGPFGETLVVDWGLAKVLDPSAPGEGLEAAVPQAAPAFAGTLPGSALGTPQYMSPEQASGRLDNLGTRTDVYSLGATLYCLLTGQAPFLEPNQAQLLERVRRGDFPPPRAVEPRIPRSLEAVCLKAMAREPGDRYASARALADDIENWLADLPVTVYREPPATRLARWGRHHKLVVAGAAALLVTAVAALAASTVLIGREQRREQVQRRRAEVNFARAQNAVDQMLSEVGSVELADVPQMEAVRGRLLEKALLFYQEFLTEKRDDPAIRIEVGRAHSRLAAIQGLKGDAVAAEGAYRQAIVIFDSLAGAGAAFKPAALLPELARAHDGLGLLLKKSNRFQESERSFRLALELRTRLAADHPQRHDDQQDLAESRYHLATLLARLPGRQPEDEEAYRGAIALQAELASAARAQPEARRKLVRYLNNLGLLLSEAGRSDQAESSFREAITVQEALLAQDPGAPGTCWQLARTESNLAVLLQASHRHHEAEQRFQHAQALQKRLAADFPAVPDYRLELGSILNNLGLLLADTDRPRLAREALRQSLSLRERLAADFPSMPDYSQKLAVTRLNLALVIEPTDPDAAERAYRDALAVHERLSAAFPRVSEYRLALGRTLYTLAGLLVRRNQPAQARLLLEQAIVHHRAALDLDKRSHRCREYLRDDHGVLAVALIRLKDHAGASKAAVELPRILPDDAFEYVRAAGFLAQCAAMVEQDETLPDLDRRRGQEDYGRRAVELLRQAFDKGLLRDPALLGQPEYQPLLDRDDFKRLESDWKQSRSSAVK